MSDKLEQNYYGRLGLPVDRFEADPAILKKSLEELITECRNSHSNTKQEWGNIHIPLIEEAIKDPVVWRSIYDEFIKLKNTKIIDDLSIFSGVISKENIELLAYNNNVSESYVMKIVEEKGVKIYTGSDRPKEVYHKTILDFESDKKVSGKLKSIQSSIEQLGYENLYMLLNSEIDGCVLNFKSDKDEVVNALNEMKKKWSRKPAANAKIQQRKSNIGKITVGMIVFFQEQQDPIEEYYKFLVYERLSGILSGCNQTILKYNVDSISDDLYKTLIDKLWESSSEITKEDAKSILNAYCDEKGIGYPKPIPNVAVCPFCHNQFEKTSPMQDICPACGRTLMIECPDCKVKRNILVTPICDGIELLRYPILEEKLKKAHELIDRIDLVEARFLMDEIDHQWRPGTFPGIDNVRKKYNRISEEIISVIEKIDKCCDDKRYREARREIDHYSPNYPNIKTRFSKVYSILEEVDLKKKAYELETDPDKKDAIVFDIIDIISDDSEVNSWLPVVHDIQSVYVGLDRAGHIVLGWKSDNKENSVVYHVRRKLNSAPINASDGEEITGGTKNTHIEDNIPEGKLYYYGVYAAGVNSQSAICCSEPVVWLKDVEARLSVRENGVDVLWPPTENNVGVAYSDKPISKRGEGIAVSSISQQGCRIEGLEKKKKYYLYIYKSIKVSGKCFFSEGIMMNFVPVEKVDFPKVTKTVGQEMDAYIINYTNYMPGNELSFFYSESGTVSIAQKQECLLSDVIKKLRPLMADKLSNDKYGIKMHGEKKIYVYPMIIKSGTAFVGNMVVLMHIEQLNVTDVGISGNNCYLRISAWPEKADRIAVCYNTDVYPDDTRDCDYRDLIYKKDYESKGAIYLSHYEDMDYYLSFFVRQNGEDIPAGNYYLSSIGSNSMLVMYEFSVGIMGGLSLKLSSDSGTIPDFSLVLKDGAMPLSEKDGFIAKLKLIEKSKDEKELIYAVENYKVKPGVYGRIFPTGSGTQFKINGKYRLK